MREVMLDGDRLVNNFRVTPLPLRYQRPADAGVWKGRQYDHAPVTTIPMYNTMPRAVKEMTTHATEALLTTCIVTGHR